MLFQASKTLRPLSSFHTKLVCAFKSSPSLPPESMPQNPPNLFTSFKQKFGIGLRYPSVQLNSSGENMFAICAEYPDLNDFINTVKLPDTFQTWFSVTTLHIWLCLVRLRREGQEGRIIKTAFIRLIWTDLKSRMRGFGIIRKQHDHVEQFNMQFFGSLFAYDEAFMMHSDVALAAALWRNFFLSSPDTTSDQLAILVGYIRKQLAHLDTLHSDQVIGKGMPTFIRLTDEAFRTEYAIQRVRYCLTWPDWAK